VNYCHAESDLLFKRHSELFKPMKTWYNVHQDQVKTKLNM